MAYPDGRLTNLVNIMDREKNSRVLYFDVLKLLAIFLVCYYHSTALIITDNVDGLAYVVHALAVIAVPLFFMVNGALLFNRSFELSNHLKKTIRLLFLGVGWTFFTNVIAMYLKGEPLTRWAVISGAYYLKFDYQNYLWFIRAMVLLYLLFPVLKFVFDHSSQQILFNYVLAIFFIFSFGDFFLNQILDVLRFVSGSNYFGKDKIEFFPGINPFGNYFYSAVYFILGGLLAKDRTESNVEFSSAKLAATFLVSWAILVGYGQMKSELAGERFDTVFPCYYSIMALLMTTAVFLVAKNFDITSRSVRLIIQRIGASTFGIYLVHYLVNLAVKNKFPEFVIPFRSAGVLGAITYAVLLVLVSYLITEILRRIPIIRGSVKI